MPSDAREGIGPEIGRRSAQFYTRSGLSTYTDAMKHLTLAFLLGCALVMAGCNSGGRIVGKWTGSLGAGADTTSPGAQMASKMLGALSLEFKSDHTFSMTMMFPFEGTWTQSGSTVTMTMTKAMGMDVSELKKMSASQGGAASSEADKPMVLTLSSDGQTLTGQDTTGKGGGSLTFKRAK